MENIYDFQCQTISGEQKPLSEYQGKVLLIVNTASKCGLTPQFSGLEDLYQQFKERGFMVLGFPCNQFANQDPAADGEIEEFCQLNYGVSFPMFSKVKVNGSETEPLFKHLKKQAPGLLGNQAIKWNFTKFLVDASGKVVKRYSPTHRPESIQKDIQALL